MSQQELQQGRAWVEDLIRRLGRERGVEVTEPFQWYPDFHREVYWLEAVMNGVPKKWSFRFEKLEDCVADRSVQRDLQRNLAQYFIPGTEESAYPAVIADTSENDKTASGPEPLAREAGVASHDISEAP